MLEKEKFKDVAGWPNFNISGPFCLGYIIRMEMGFSYLICKPQHQKLSNQTIELSVQAGHVFGIQMLSRLHPFSNEPNILRMLYLYAIGSGENSAILREKSDVDIRDELAHMLERQQLLMFEIENPWGQGRYTRYIAPEKQQKPKESAPVISAPSTTWVDINLVDEEGEPIPNQEYVVKAGGIEFTGQTDASGHAHIPGVITGLCDVSFKGIEGWHPEGTATANDEPIETVHTIAEDETLADIAQQYGYHSWQTIYQHDANQDLRELRKKPNQLQPGDEVHIPKMENIVASARSDQQNEFVLKSHELKTGIYFMYQIDIDAPTAKNDEVTLEHNESEWSQIIKVADLSEIEEDWVELFYSDVPKTGTFNLIQDPKDDEKPFYVFWDVPYEELGNLTPEAEPLPEPEEEEQESADENEADA